MDPREELFQEVCSVDFLTFKFGSRGYQDQLNDSITKTNALAGVKVELVSLRGGASSSSSMSSSPSASNKVVWVTHNFAFLGGSLGCAEGEKITRAFEYSTQNKLPIVVQCRTGGARMQEGTSSLMQMAKVSVAVDAHKQSHLPFISVLSDPTYGGVSASYAMQADIRIATSDARIGFAGPEVILNTMCAGVQAKYDTDCPSDFQSAQFVMDHGQIDMVLDTSKGSAQTIIEESVGNIVSLFSMSSTASAAAFEATELQIDEADKTTPFDYTRARSMDRPQTQDIIKQLFANFIELSGDGCVGRDRCIRGGIGSFQGRSCVVFGSYKGHTHQTYEEANYGMASPHGYRTALRLMKLAERFGFPVVTLVDTVGAWPTFECESDGQSEAIATNLTVMAGLKVPIITLVIGEGGSGGALGIGMGNVIGMLSGGYFGVISPEGAASILGRYDSEEDKRLKFASDCHKLATAQCIYANQLKDLGVVDEIIWEPATSETYKDFPVLKLRIANFIASNLKLLQAMEVDDLISHRYSKFRKIGSFLTLSQEERSTRIEEAKSQSKPPPRAAAKSKDSSLLIKHLAEETVAGGMSRYRNLAPRSCPETPYVPPPIEKVVKPEGYVNAKIVLDTKGPEAMATWVRETSKQRVLVTDTTMRDAHQSLLATRVRSLDLLGGASIANEVLKDAFSFESWGGATFDVCMRFLDECPWERLRQLRKACPDVCLQMLIRGANAVGYTSYPDNVVSEFVRLAALNGMDIFRIFDCFNDIEQMKVCIDAVRAAGKVAEVAVCYTGNVMTSKVYNIDYYRDVVKQIVDAGAHMIAIKDMAGLMRPFEVEPMITAIRSVTDLPIHFHTHATASGSLAVCMEMARCGCDIIDFCTAAMADGTSQPSINTFIAMMQGAPRATGIDYLKLESYDMYWARVRQMYSPFESGMLSGTARVFEHQIPGGQYSNLLVQCQSMGLWDRWEEVLDAYRDVNELFGDIVKVTPSSKCVGDLALYLVNRRLKCSDLLNGNAGKVDWPESVTGLLKGELGFPHRGFPHEVEALILKGQPKLSIRAGLALPPCNFSDNLKELEAKFAIPISEEMAMSSLMYPKVFSDYITRIKKKSDLLQYLPTPVYLYALRPGQSFSMEIPTSLVGQILASPPASSGEVGVCASSAGCSSDAKTNTKIDVALKRVGPLKSKKRIVSFLVNGETQDVEVKDTTGVFVFEGPMADASKTGQIGSPMPGVIEKLPVKEGQEVKAGDMVCTVSAMKMEVKVTAPISGVISSLSVASGTRVIEGALLMTIKNA